MKKHYTLLFLLFTFWSQAQNGITYQALILNPNSEELPGVDNSRLPFVNQSICLDFKIINAASKVDYQETLTTRTDEFGMVNVIIGTGNRKAGIATQFKNINWDGTAKNLVVSFDSTGNCSQFIEISDQPFTYVPYALYAANGGATGAQGPVGPAGTNGLDGKTVLNGTTNPSANVGTNGDFYINTTTNNLFGPKANGLWGNGVPLVGQQGIQGVQGPQGVAGTNGTNGTIGLSAYQIWLNAGNTGTEAQFLTAIRGATGAQGSQGLQGPTGLTGATGSQGIAGTNGTNGLSAYQIWLNAGNIGSEAQFLTALRGATGTQGPQGSTGLTGATGATGPQGIAGINGINGLSAYQTWLNAGNTGTEAQFLTSIRGATGAQGPQGIQGVTGLTGATGQQGTAGTNGANGLDGLDGKTILNGNQNPINSVANNGDFYINTTTNSLFGPKTSGAWGSGIALVGPQGVAGTNGKNTLVNTTTEAAGANCANGGTKIEVGLDVNSNGVLDSGEVNSNLTKYVCNGVSPTNNFNTFNNFVYNDFVGSCCEWYGVVNTTNPGGNGQLTEFTLPLYNKSGYLKLKLNYGGFNGTGKIQIFAPNNQLLNEFLSAPNSTLEKTIGINLDQSWANLTIKSSIVNFTSGGQFLVRKLIEEFVLFN